MTPRSTKPAHRSRRYQRRIIRLRFALRRAVQSAAARLRRKTSRQTSAIDPAQLASHWERIGLTLLRFGGASDANRVQLFCDGDALFEDLWPAIEHAQHRVSVETYILEPDRVGLRTLEALTAAAKRGCDVWLLLDAVGSSHLTESFLRPLRDAGATIQFFNPIWQWRRRASLFRRDHRKIIVIDDCIGYCGGMNISEDYAGPTHGNSRFQDCHIRLEGPCIRDLAAVTIASWQMICDRTPPLADPPDPAGNSFLQVQSSRGWQGRRTIQRTLRLTTRHSARHCYVTTPYFVPPRRLVHALTRASQLGVDVRLLTAGISDVPIVAMAARHIYGNLLRHGVKVYELYDVTLHAKTITIDGIYSTVGSFNLDQWSHKRNLEVNVTVIDADVAAQLESIFHNNLAKAREVTLENWTRRPWWKRLIHWTAYQLLRL